MNKKTKAELIIFILAALIFVISQLGEMRKPDIQGSSSVTETAGQSYVNASGENLTASGESFIASGPGETLTASVPGESLTAPEEASVREDISGIKDKDSVALYISVYGRLPDNYITKAEAREAGWVSEEGNLDRVCPGKSIGGDRFGNYEGLLPEKDGRKYFECDINYDPKEGYRGAERIIYSNDGLIYYSADHYKTFELLYGEP